jgi:hypothetical protein
MLKNSKAISIFACLALLSASSQAADSVKNGNPCLSGICVGDDLLTHKALNWVPLPPHNTTDYDIEVAKAIVAPQPPAVLRGAASTIAFHHVDASRFDNLAKIKGYCQEQTFVGDFLSESGFRTTVTSEAFPSADSSSQIVRVALITRNFPDGYTDEQINQLHQQLKKDYAGVIEAAFDATKPFWQFDAFHHSVTLFAGASL